MELALAELYSEGNIVTPITPFDEKARLKKGRGGRNFSYDKSAESKYLEKVERGVVAGGSYAHFYNYMPCR